MAPSSTSSPHGPIDTASASYAAASVSSRQNASAARALCLAWLDASVALHAKVQLGSIAACESETFVFHQGACARDSLLPSDWIAVAKSLATRKESAALDRALVSAGKDFRARGELSQVTGSKFSRAMLKSADRIGQALNDQRIADCEWTVGVVWNTASNNPPGAGSYFEVMFQPRIPAPGRNLAGSGTRNQILDRALGALKSQFGELALFESCETGRPRGFGTPELLAAGEARLLRKILTRPSGKREALGRRLAARASRL